MKQKIITINLLLVVLLFSFSTFSGGINQSIETPFEKPEECAPCFNSLKESRQETHDVYFFGGALEIPDDYELPPENAQISGNPIPTEWDWRDANYEGKRGDWTTPAKYQGWCGSCWDFAAIGALESVISIREKDPTLDIDLSEQHVLSCSNAGNCENGGLSIDVFRWMNNNELGTITEECFPYQANDDINCGDKCPDWQNQLIPIKDTDGDGHSYGYWKNADTDFIKEKLIEKGPLVARMNIYDDFYDYKSGVYQHKSGDLIAHHAVVLVGYKDTPDNSDYQGYWICKNSFGKYWGENGFFRIAYGEGNICYQVIYVEYQADSIPNLLADCQFDVSRWSPPSPMELIDFHGVAAGGTKPYSWHWDFGDGYVSTDRDPTHSFEKSGFYDVTLTVTDKDGSISTDIDQILIDSTPQVPVIQGPATGKFGETYTYKFSAKDPDGDDLTYKINWGEGPESEKVGPFKSEEEFELSHVWEGTGNYNIYVTVEDVYEVVNSSSLKIKMPRARLINNEFMQLLVKILFYSSLLIK